MHQQPQPQQQQQQNYTQASINLYSNHSPNNNNQTNSSLGKQYYSPFGNSPLDRNNSNNVALTEKSQNIPQNVHQNNHLSVN
jgi:hypothetical protein